MRRRFAAVFCAGSLPHSRLARGPRGARQGERRRLQRRLHFSFFYVLWRCVECYWPRTPLTEGVAYLWQFIACKGIALWQGHWENKKKEPFTSATMVNVGCLRSRIKTTSKMWLPWLQPLIINSFPNGPGYIVCFCFTVSFYPHQRF